MSHQAARDSGDFYDLLGISPEAGEDQVRRAYRILARQLHPDVNPAPDAAARFALISQAYAVLGDPARRRHYDAQRRRPPGGGGPGRPMARPAPSFGGARGVLRGADVELAVHLSLREAAFGVERGLAVPRREVCAVCLGSGAAAGGISQRCPRCHGTGGARTPGEECPRCQGSGVLGEPACPNCGGSGRRKGQTTVLVTIPPAVEDGQVLRLKGDGDAGPRNGPRGDLLLRVVVDPDPVLRRRGADILMDLPLTTGEAQQGGTREVPTLRGPRPLRIPARARDGTVLRLSGAGLRLRGRWQKGDQFVTLRVPQPP